MPYLSAVAISLVSIVAKCNFYGFRCDTISCLRSPDFEVKAFRLPLQLCTSVPLFSVEINLSTSCLDHTYFPLFACRYGIYK